MGQKVSPVGLRVGINRNWDSRWYANDQDFAGLLHEDIKIREYLLKKLKTASVARVEIERSKNRVTIFVHTSRPGVVIGKDGEAVDATSDGKTVVEGYIQVLPQNIATTTEETINVSVTDTWGFVKVNPIKVKVTVE